MMSDRVCVDASLVVALLLNEEGSEGAYALMEKWKAEGAELVAPSFMLWEVGSAIRKHTLRGAVVGVDPAELLEAALALPVRGVEGAEVLRSAWRLACDLELPVLYDAAYLAVAETTGSTLWTLDRQLVEAVKDRLGYVRLARGS